MARPHPEWRSNDVLTPEQQRRLARDMQAALDQVRTGIISLDARTQMQLRALFESASTALSRGLRALADRSEEHTSELQSLMRISYAVFCLKKKNTTKLNETVQ